MKILWITNLLFPEAKAKISGNEFLLNGSGGWLVSAAKSLIQNKNIELSIAAPSSLVNKLTRLSVNNVTYYAIPCKNERKYNPTFEQTWKVIADEVKPEIVHIHGTEFAHGLSFCKASIDVPHVLSIQGIAEEIGYHYLDGLSFKDVYCNVSIFDLLYTGTLYTQKKKYIEHGIKIERELIKCSKYIIGRTAFDKAHVTIINPSIKYYKCNESLQDAFYDPPYWSYEKCKKHTIFLSQSNYPVKGLQQVLKAMPYVLKRYPDTRIRIAGEDITSVRTVKQWLTCSTYSRYICNLINSLGLNNYVYFTGPLNAIQMKQEYLNCNVFVSPSSIENSSNSLGEAQLLGVPCIASYVGGTPDMIPNPDCGILYRFSDYIMLADAICSSFEKKWNAAIEQKLARERHDKKKNMLTLLNIYKSIIQE